MGGAGGAVGAGGEPSAAGRPAFTAAWLDPVHQTVGVCTRSPASPPATERAQPLRLGTITDQRETLGQYGQTLLDLVQIADEGERLLHAVAAA
jgi:hypothetical protein